ncbi:peptidylprolyl isomerase [Kineosphaera limosa]|uniref:peptidylprolyl isomerase n=1 Tax=Kineosphaera limosa NBRC 100340 TaxID=1184609 RepID=K6WL70_9MICO|nr:FKBP-type peptidyl-prolyl cis-trans isomerase [Kineosphaera limosa]NYE03219.1 peptidylprolyl isomerase [Kineosphaera limosa]GAB94556.1 peptidyl-prolyl cis-trans isomerase FKBP-type [Kineosphaera limosa NBRC 100340]
MPVSRRLVAASVLPFVLLLSACGGHDPGSESEATAQNGATPTATAQSGILDQITIEPARSSSQAPTLKLPQVPLTVAQPEHLVVEPGNGAPITADQKVVAKYLLVNARDGKPRATMWADKPVTLPIGQIPQFSPLIGQKLGSQVLLAIPASTAMGQSGDEKLDIRPADTLLYLIEPISATAPLKEAEGTVVPPKAGLPTVQMGETANDPAKITVPDSAPPTQTVAQPLIIGDGPRVVAGQTVRVTYTGVTWRDPGNPFDYSGKQPQGYAEFQIGTGNLIKAWDQHIVGQTVGTRLLLVVPPADGYGAAGSGAIKGDDTMVFVLDILDAS